MACQTPYNHLRTTFLLLSVRLTIIQGMPFYHTEYAIVGLPVVSLLDHNHPSDAFLPH